MIFLTVRDKFKIIITRLYFYSKPSLLVGLELSNNNIPIYNVYVRISEIMVREKPVKVKSINWLKEMEWKG